MFNSDAFNENYWIILNQKKHCNQNPPIPLQATGKWSSRQLHQIFIKIMTVLNQAGLVNNQRSSQHLQLHQWNQQQATMRKKSLQQKQSTITYASNSEQKLKIPRYYHPESWMTFQKAGKTTQQQLQWKTRTKNNLYWYIYYNMFSFDVITT